ncbi:MAG: ADP-glyceromanno-heptose 6-epimerase [Ignavibacteriae bacterium HGW-Ignavibacteriae-3]|nr:MAG: ADP-glyceromanno-heptose 6-epimerase [Ignavibacteriae bacterium HGW-Ignavibacteriae-3]
MIVVTGGAGFIGSAVVWKLNRMGNDKIIVVDELGKDEKWKNLNGLRFADFFHKDDFMGLVLQRNFPFKVSSVIHLGACSATTEKDADYLMDNNVHYSQELAKFCLENGIRFIYASSAATYGDGSNGYEDNEANLDILRPLNMYGYSKHLFDTWIKRNGLMDKVVGLKYFNVYGPNEYHKDEMRSVVHKAFEQVRDAGKVQLFKSYKPEYKDGEQKRDFIYIKDAVDMTVHFLEHRDVNGIYNVGTGKAQTWVELVTALFNAVGKPVNIEFVDMPEDIREKYQYFTEASLDKIKNAGYNKPVMNLQDGVTDYVKNYLLKAIYFGMSRE